TWPLAVASRVETPLPWISSPEAPTVVFTVPADAHVTATATIAARAAAISHTGADASRTTSSSFSGASSCRSAAALNFMAVSPLRPAVVLSRQVWDARRGNYRMRHEIVPRSLYLATLPRQAAR